MGNVHGFNFKLYICIVYSMIETNLLEPINKCQDIKITGFDLPTQCPESISPVHR